jgi:hypothetical protein
MTIEMLDVRGERPPRSRPPGTSRLSEAVGITQRVEKVDVGPVGGPREPQNKAETLPRQRNRPPFRGPK